jgi:hypothetical protein
MVSYGSLYGVFMTASPLGSTTAMVVSEVISSSLVLWLPSVSTVGVSTGVLGPGPVGTVLGSVVLTGSPLLMTTSLRTRGCLGTSVDVVGSWLGSSVIAGVSGCVYRGFGACVLGTDVSSVGSADPISLRGILNTELSRVCGSRGGYGLMGDDRFLWGLSEGISLLVRTSVCSGVCSGPGGLSSGSAPSSGVLVVS